MQTLGLSDSTPRTESRLKSLFWPTITNQGDVEYITEQGFWICGIVAVITVIFGIVLGSGWWALFEGSFFLLGGMGVRQRSRAAAIAIFLAYLLSGAVLMRYSGQGFNVVRVIFLSLLLANIRATWLASRWLATEAELPVVRLDETIWDKLSGWLPQFLWPKLRIAFYLLAAIEIGLLLLGLFAPRA